MQGKVYKITRTVCGKHRGTSEEPIKDKEVRSLITEAEKKKIDDQSISAKERFRHTRRQIFTLILNP